MACMGLVWVSVVYFSNISAAAYRIRARYSFAVLFPVSVGVHKGRSVSCCPFLLPLSSFLFSWPVFFVAVLQWYSMPLFFYPYTLEGGRVRGVPCRVFVHLWRLHRARYRFGRGLLLLWLGRVSFPFSVSCMPL